MNKVKLNLTVELRRDEVVPFEQYLSEHLRLIDSRILPDTTQLYENDAVFKKLDKNYRKAKKERDIYINKHL